MRILPEYVSFLKENRTREQAAEIYNQRIKDSEEVYEKFSDEFFTRECPVCGGDNHEEDEKFNNQYEVVKCRKCSSLFVNPTPSLEALDYYYNNCECNKQLGSLLKERVGKRGIILSERAFYVLSIVEQLLNSRREVKVLEVGCNSGAFLHELNEALIKKRIESKVSLVGIDIDKYAIERPVSNSISLHHSSAEEFVKNTGETYDLILHFELVEHLPNPFEFCCALHNLLSDQGLMYFHTPNALGLDNQALSYNDFRPLAHGIFPPMHLNAFTTQNVSHFLIRAGFKVRDIATPGNFDVDIVKEFGCEKNDFSLVQKIKDEKTLAIFQYLIRSLNASSHLAVLAEK